MTTAPARWTRRATDVEALYLGDLGDLHCAELWLRGHHVDTAHRHPAVAARGLLVPTGPGGQFTVARIGHWVVHDLTTGRFDLTDNDTFLALHRTPTPRGDLEALIDATVEPRS